MSFKESLLKDYDDMLTLRDSLGYSQEKNLHCVKDFLLFCGDVYPDCGCITKEMLDSWLSEKQFNTNATHNYTITKIRGFTKYLIAIGKDAYTPNQDYSVKDRRYAPYIFTDEELKKLFREFDNMPTEFRAPGREYIVPVLFRMMYCCGMRPTEPLSLLFEDVNLGTGEVFVRQSKGRRDRRILMSKELLELCRQYNQAKHSRTHFFEKRDGNPFDAGWSYYQFKLCWRNSGLEKCGNPRPYDLRHNFATRTMVKWLNEGKDLMSMAPYLSAYMGHTEFNMTMYYINLLPEMLQNSVGIDWKRFSCIYPEVACEKD